jgi:hypothetical protein
MLKHLEKVHASVSLEVGKEKTPAPSAPSTSSDGKQSALMNYYAPKARSMGRGLYITQPKWQFLKLRRKTEKVIWIV